MSLFPCWAEALSAWLSREGAVGSDDICCSSVIISAELPGTLWVGWQWYGGQTKPTEELRLQPPFLGLCGVERSACQLPAPFRAYLTSLPCLSHEPAGSKDFAAPGQHMSLLHNLSWRLSHCQGEDKCTLKQYKPPRNCIDFPHLIFNGRLAIQENGCSFISLIALCRDSHLCPLQSNAEDSDHAFLMGKFHNISWVWSRSFPHSPVLTHCFPELGFKCDHKSIKQMIPQDDSSRLTCWNRLICLKDAWPFPETRNKG